MAFKKNDNQVRGMSTAEATRYVREMVSREARGPGDFENAMGRIEAKYGIGFWTLHHLRRGAAKTVDVNLFQRIKMAFIDHCEGQAKRLLHEASTARMTGLDNDDVADIEDQIRALASKLDAAKTAAKARGKA